MEALRYGLTAGGLASLCSTIGWIACVRMRLKFYRYIVDLAAGKNQELDPVEVIRATVPKACYPPRQTRSRPASSERLDTFKPACDLPGPEASYPFTTRKRDEPSRFQIPGAAAAAATLPCGVTYNGFRENSRSCAGEGTQVGEEVTQNWSVCAQPPHRDAPVDRPK
jgi:hypothetical protein